jgi:hypothetical protein
MERIITLTTDFGLRDPYQGALKGAVLKVNPRANIVDITHLVKHGDVREGAYILSGAALFYPDTTVHLAVVDPGVGTRRRPILIETERYFFVGPDNGLFGLIAERDGIKRVIELTSKEYFRPEVSETFHGRDIFAPVAAHLTLGVPPESFGPVISDIQGVDDVERLDAPAPATEGGTLFGRIVHVDNFGNLITNIKGDDLMEHITENGPGRVEAVVMGRAVSGLSSTYGSVEDGAPVALIGSSGYLEVALNRGNAAEEFGAGCGTVVELRVVKR